MTMISQYKFTEQYKKAKIRADMDRQELFYRVRLFHARYRIKPFCHIRLEGSGVYMRLAGNAEMTLTLRGVRLLLKSLRKMT